MVTKKQKKIVSENTIEEILNLPGGKKTLAKYHLPCLTCPLAEEEIKFLRLGQAAKMYRFDLKNMLKELNSG